MSMNCQNFVRISLHHKTGSRPEDAVYTYCILMRMGNGKASEVPYCLRQGRKNGDRGSSEWEDGEFSAELLIWRAGSTNVILAEAGMTFKACHYWLGLDFGVRPGMTGFIVFLALETPIPDCASSHPARSGRRLREDPNCRARTAGQEDMS